MLRAQQIKITTTTAKKAQKETNSDLLCTNKLDDNTTAAAAMAMVACARTLAWSSKAKENATTQKQMIKMFHMHWRSECKLSALKMEIPNKRNAQNKWNGNEFYLKNVPLQNCVDCYEWCAHIETAGGESSCILQYGCVLRFKYTMFSFVWRFVWSLGHAICFI